jgi:hypothetical protein
MLRKCFLFVALASGALLLGTREASACWRGGYRTACCYQTYSYPACYDYPTYYTYQPTYTYPTYYTYQPSTTTVEPTVTYQPVYYTTPTWYGFPIAHRWGWRLFR